MLMSWKSLIFGSRYELFTTQMSLEKHIYCKFKKNKAKLMAESFKVEITVQCTAFLLHSIT